MGGGRTRGCTARLWARDRSLGANGGRNRRARTLSHIGVSEAAACRAAGLSVNGAQRTEPRHPYRCPQATLGRPVDENAFSSKEYLDRCPVCVDGVVFRTLARPKVCACLRCLLRSSSERGRDQLSAPQIALPVG